MIGNLLVLEHEVSNNIKLEGDLPYNVLKQKEDGKKPDFFFGEEELK